MFNGVIRFYDFAEQISRIKDTAMRDSAVQTRLY